MLWYDEDMRRTILAWRPQGMPGGVANDILAVGQMAVQNGYYHVSASSVSDSMYYARGPRPPGKDRPDSSVTLRVSDHEPVSQRQAESVNVIIHPGEEHPPESSGTFYAKAGDQASIQAAFSKADAELRRREALEPWEPVAVAWVMSNCRLASCEWNDEYVAAFRSPVSGKVYTGPTHGDAFSKSDVKSINDLTDEEFLRAEGFSLRDGSGFISREEALDQLGFSCTEDR